MAEGKLQKLEDELNCRICLDRYEDPKLLQCFHFYCRKCLVKLVDRDEQGQYALPCPECRQITPVPSGRVKNLTSAFYINRLLGIMDGAQVGVEKKVEEKKEEPKQNKQCCSTHTDEELKLYCTTCEKLICYKCAIAGSQHHIHSYEDLDKSFTKYKEEVSSLQKLIEKQMKEISDVLDVVATNSGILQDQKTAIMCQDGIEKVPLFGKLSQIFEDKLKKLSNQEKELHLHQAKRKGGLDFIKTTSQGQDILEVLAMKADVLKRIRQLTFPVPPNFLTPWDSADKVSHMRAFKVQELDEEEMDPRYFIEGLFGYPATEATQSYSSAILKLPVAFYFNALTGIVLLGNFVRPSKFPGLPLPLADSLNPLTTRRSRHDSFRPPNGEPLYYLLNLGYGGEVGLPDGMQEIYDPCTKKSFILDHSTSKVVMEDFRPIKSEQVTPGEPTFITLDYKVAGSMKFTLCSKEQVIEVTSQRARSKPVGCIVYARGKDGHPGVDGREGVPGIDGQHGSSSDRNFLQYGPYHQVGLHGRDGLEGGRGENGSEGDSGTRGSNVTLILSGSADKLQVKGSKKFTVDLGGCKSERILLVDNRGGNGGRGGLGGKGGRGGTGGSGGDGARGADGMPGFNGGNGTDGGNGGHGGKGGEGGNAGDGGSAGGGGMCLIEAEDPKLLMLVEVDLRQGDPGPGVHIGGEGGNGGAPGRGGRGGPGGDGGPPRGGRGIPYKGLRGQCGRDGYYGKPGGQGSGSRNGGRGTNGGILWVVKNHSKVATSGTRFDAKVVSYKVTPSLNDGSFEPNERVIVSAVVIHNTGGLDLPSGASVFMPSTPTVRFDQFHFSTPHAIPAGKTYTVPFTFLGRVVDIPPPFKPGRCKTSKAQFHSRVELLGRPFERSFREHNMVVQYPVQLESLHSPKNMKQGEVAVISIVVKNTSNIPYGDCDYSGGQVTLHLHFDSRIIPLCVESNTSSQYEVTHDPNLRDSTFVEFFKIRSRELITVSLKVMMESEAEFFDSCVWQADLRLRDKLIEYDYKSIRVAPAYNPQKPLADVLLVTGESTTCNEYIFWSHSLKSLGVSMDIWDTVMNSGFSLDSRTGKRHTNSWYGQYVGKVIVYTHCDLQQLSPLDIEQHFHGDNTSSSMLLEFGSSLIVFMPHEDKKNETAMLRHLATVSQKLELPEKAYTGRHFSMPATNKLPPLYAKAEMKIFKSLEEKYPNQVSILLSRYTKVSLFSSLCYSYGSVDVRKLPLLKSSKFVLVDGAAWLDSDNISPVSANVSSVSRQGQAIITVIYSLPIPAKLNLLKGERVTTLALHLPKQRILSVQELVMIGLAREVADELYACENLRMKQLYTDIVQHTEAYVRCGRIILRGLKLIKFEYEKRRSAGLKHKKVTQACLSIADMSGQIEKMLQEAGVNKSRLEDMPSIESLLDSSRVHHCHQHCAEEEVWNLVDN